MKVKINKSFYFFLIEGTEFRPGNPSLMINSPMSKVDEIVNLLFGSLSSDIVLLVDFIEHFLDLILV